MMNKDNKLDNWLETNRLKKSKKLQLLLFSYHGRAIILLYLLVYSESKLVRLFAARKLRSQYHIECSCRAIGYNFRLPHPRNIIIAAERIGDWVQINQNATIGGNMQKTVKREWGVQKLPIIGNHVTIYTNAVVGGPVIIGDHVIVGANCVITHDVDNHSMILCSQRISQKLIEVGDGFYRVLDNGQND